MTGLIKKTSLIAFLIVATFPLFSQPSPETVSDDAVSSPPESEVDRIKREILAVYPNVDFGREVDEPAQVRWLFENEDDVRELLGLDPRFIYNPKNLPDPMIIPWVRQNVIAQELFNDAMRYIKEGRIMLAQQTLKTIVDSYPASSVFREAQDEYEKIRQLASLQEVQIQQSRETQRVVLPPWVYENAKGIIWDPVNPVILIGDYTLTVGDPIPKYPDVTIHEIKQSSVVFKFKDILFDINVEGL